MHDRDRIMSLERLVAQLTRQVAGLPIRLADGGGGGGSDLILFLGVSTETILAGTGPASSRVPGKGDGTITLELSGSGRTTDWENYSLVEISTGSLCLLAANADHVVIIDVFC